MKRAIMIAGLLVAGAAAVGATEHSKMPQPSAASAEFAKIKALAGKWTGTSDGPEGANKPAAAEYRVTSGGSAVVETLFPGTDHEMVSVYHERNGQLAITHYCMLGNQPELTLTGETPNQLELSLAPGSSIKSDTETHMHALTLVWADPDHLTQTWTLYEQGKAAGATTITLSREQSWLEQEER